MSDGKRRSVYVCHTYYHVYVTLLKEFAKPKEDQGYATLILSTMSTDFETFEDRVKASGYFEAVYKYEEANFEDLPEVKKYHHPSDNFIVSIWNRFLFTKKYGKAQEKLVPVDFKAYDDVYVFCDSDPIGFYLNYKHIYYHSVEDGLNTLVHNDSARKDNDGHFNVKVFMSKKLNWIFVHNGYGKYCLDMEVNDIAKIKFPCPYYVELRRETLVERLDARDKDYLCRIFIKDIDRIKELSKVTEKKSVMILTEPLCELDVRKQLFKDLFDEYKDEYTIIIKQHPRDMLDYSKEFPEYILVDRTVPMEIFNYIEKFSVDLVVGVLTELSGIQYAKNKKRLGAPFMDKYESIECHITKFSNSEENNQ